MEIKFFVFSVEAYFSKFHENEVNINKRNFKGGLAKILEVRNSWKY